jgi:hypothetical protein
MRLRNQKIGPVTLRAIDYAPNMSEETLAFTAMVKIAGVGEASVRNDGQGGGNYVQSRVVHNALEEFAKTFPDRSFSMDEKEHSYSMNGDVLISCLLDRALNQKDGMPVACDDCGDTDHLKLEQRPDLGAVRRKDGLWAPCLCETCNEKFELKATG